MSRAIAEKKVAGEPVFERLYKHETLSKKIAVEIEKSEAEYREKSIERQRRASRHEFSH